MGRPTEDKKESSIILRINSDLKRELEGKAQEDGVSLSGYLRNVIQNNFAIHNENSFVIHNSEVNVIQNVMQNEYEALLDGVSLDVLNDLSLMATLSGGSLAGLLKDLQEKLNKGLIVLDNGKIQECPFDYSEFIKRCDDMDLDYQKAMDKLVKKPWIN